MLRNSLQIADLRVRKHREQLLPRPDFKVVAHAVGTRKGKNVSVSHLPAPFVDTVKYQNAAQLTSDR